MTFVTKFALKTAAVIMALIISAGNTSMAQNDDAASGSEKCAPSNIKHTGCKPVKGGFAWGAEAGGSIDMSANDMSSIDFAAYFGYSRGWLNFIGVGAEIDIMLNNACRSFPVYASFRTNFRKKPSLLFMDIKGGVSVNCLPSNHTQNGAYVFAGLGINLARSKKFASHIIIGYTYKQYNDFVSRSNENIEMSDVHLASVRLGITF